MDCPAPTLLGHPMNWKLKNLRTGSRTESRWTEGKKEFGNGRSSINRAVFHGGSLGVLGITANPLAVDRLAGGFPPAGHVVRFGCPNDSLLDPLDPSWNTALTIKALGLEHGSENLEQVQNWKTAKFPSCCILATMLLVLLLLHSQLRWYHSASVVAACLSSGPWGLVEPTLITFHYCENCIAISQQKITAMFSLL